MAKTREQIMKEVTDIFHDVFDDDEIVLTEETTANDIEDWDSLMHITLITELENHFHIKFRLKEVTGMENVGGTIDLIEEKLGE
ncbi:MAG: acyl carrier protein [Lachnospiraceae bacterium]|nr:acyl carrier protein [Lachnospiraceae bacterium]